MQKSTAEIEMGLSLGQIKFRIKRVRIKRDQHGNKYEWENASQRHAKAAAAEKQLLHRCCPLLFEQRKDKRNHFWPAAPSGSSGNRSRLTFEEQIKFQQRTSRSGNVYNPTKLSTRQRQANDVFRTEERSALWKRTHHKFSWKTIELSIHIARKVHTCG